MKTILLFFLLTIQFQQLRGEALNLPIVYRGEHLAVQLPQSSDKNQWYFRHLEMDDKGNIFEFWCKKNDKDADSLEVIVLTTHPWKKLVSEEPRNIDTILKEIWNQYKKLSYSAKQEICEKSENEAIMKLWIDNKDLRYVRVILTPNAEHGAFYAYSGKNTSSEMKNKWVTFLKENVFIIDGERRIPKNGA